MPLLPSNIANLHLYGIRLPLYACLRNQGSAKDKISRDTRNSIDNMSSRSDYLSHKLLHDNNSDVAVQDVIYFQKMIQKKVSDFKRDTI